MKTMTLLSKTMFTFMTAVCLLSASNLSFASENTDKDTAKDNVDIPLHICAYFPWCKIEPRVQVPPQPPQRDGKAPEQKHICNPFPWCKITPT